MNRLASYDFERERQLSRRIRLAGIPIARSFSDHGAPPLLIRQDLASCNSSEIFDFGGGTGLVLPLKIVPSIGRFFLSAFHVQLDRWRDGCFRPLEAMERREWPHYELCGRADLRFHRDEVLNRFMMSNKPLRREYPVCGVLIARTQFSIPEDIQHGEVLEGLVWIYDQFDRPYSSEEIRLRADRETWKQLKQVGGAPTEKAVTIGSQMRQLKEDLEANDSRRALLRSFGV